MQFVQPEPAARIVVVAVQGQSPRIRSRAQRELGQTGPAEAASMQRRRLHRTACVQTQTALTAKSGVPPAGVFMGFVRFAETEGKKVTAKVKLCLCLIN
jgi:hypothetical protein